MKQTTSVRQRILAVAQRRIAERGLLALDTRTLAEEANASLSSFHREFKTQDRLRVAVFEDGWAEIDRHVTRSSFAGTDSIEHLLDILLDNILNSYEARPDAVASAIIVGLGTIGDPSRVELRKTEAYQRFRHHAANIAAQLSKRLPNATPAELHEGIDALFGAVARRLMMQAPMCRSTVDGNPEPPFDRAAFKRIILRIASGVFPSSTAQHATNQSTPPLLDS